MQCRHQALTSYLIEFQIDKELTARKGDKREIPMDKFVQQVYKASNSRLIKDLKISLFKTIVVKVFASVFMAGCSYWHFKRGLFFSQVKRENSVGQ